MNTHRTSATLELARWPATIACAATVGASAAGFAWLHGTGPASMAVAGASAIVSIGVWIAMATHSARFARYRYERERRRTRAASPDLDTLRKGLNRPGAEQAKEQLSLLVRKMEALREVLLKRLNEGELTFQRYLISAEQVYLAGLDNLHEIEVSLTAQSAMDIGYLARRRDALAASDDPRSAEERRAIAEREAGYRAMQERVAGLSTQNEVILSALDATAVSLADARIGARAGSTNAESAMAQLHRLAAMAKQYEQAS